MSKDSIIHNDFNELPLTKVYRDKLTKIKNEESYRYIVKSRSDNNFLLRVILYLQKFYLIYSRTIKLQIEYIRCLYF